MDVEEFTASNRAEPRKYRHDPEELRKNLCHLLDNYNPIIEYLAAASIPLNSIATSASILTFLSLMLFLNGKIRMTRTISGLNVIILLVMVALALGIQLGIGSARLRFTRINHDRSAFNEFTEAEDTHLVRLVSIAQNSSKILDRIQWLYLNGLFKVLYGFLGLTVTLLIWGMLIELLAI
ncbi:MAG: hypothetical protein ACFFFG_08795 [Candidatus Thorarchaeota archaeon]